MTDTPTRSPIAAVAVGLAALVVCGIPISVNVLLVQSGWQGCLVDCSESSTTDPGLFWLALASLVAFVVDIGLWVVAGYYRFARQWTIAAAVVLAIAIITFVLI